MYFSLSYINNVYDRYKKLIFYYTAFVIMNLSGITYYLCLLRAPVINSETKESNQTKCTCFIGRQRDIHKDHIVNISGFYQL